MRNCWVALSAGAVAILALTASFTVSAAETSGNKTAAEQLNERTKDPDAATSSGNTRGLSDSAVRIMSGYAWSILPSEVKKPDGSVEKVDKSDPKKFFIPIDDARDVIRAAMRSAYAQVCDLPQLAEQNYVTLMEGEQNRGVWSKQQMQFINALHAFSVSYFTGNLKITAKDPDDKQPSGQQGSGSDSVAANADSGSDAGFQPKRPTCTPEKKQAVTQAITAFVSSVRAAPAQQGAQAQQGAPSQAPVATPVSPETAGAN